MANGGEAICLICGIIILGLRLAAPRIFSWKLKLYISPVIKDIVLSIYCYYHKKLTYHGQ